MMNTTKRQHCPKCQRAKPVCYCHTLRPIHNTWPIHIIQHPNESKHAIGTAKIAQLSLQQCQTTVITNLKENEQLNQLLHQKTALLVYPGKESLPINKIDRHFSQPLIFLDGSWRKTQRMLYETPVLDALTKVSFSPPQPSRYRIRKEPNSDAISTIEAIAFVLGQLENNHERYQPLLNTMDWMINKQIEYMGNNTYNENYLKK